jgi:hypothetical protein
MRNSWFAPKGAENHLGQPSAINSSLLTERSSRTFRISPRQNIELKLPYLSADDSHLIHQDFSATLFGINSGISQQSEFFPRPFCRWMGSLRFSDRGQR